MPGIRHKGTNEFPPPPESGGKNSIYSAGGVSNTEVLCLDRNALSRGKLLDLQNFGKNHSGSNWCERFFIFKPADLLLRPPTRMKNY